MMVRISYTSDKSVVNTPVMSQSVSNSLPLQKKYIDVPGSIPRNSPNAAISPRPHMSTAAPTSCHSRARCYQGKVKIFASATKFARSTRILPPPGRYVVAHRFKFMRILMKGIICINVIVSKINRWLDYVSN
ncbi:hypothetical protein NPIL_41061 [Nephila pilipes]|uniref:Uncharacterized protein n=1 Tax=Nephila pilipes TaxID=299642 RepID=A0A8X6UIX4_NEPPI|nr:hypothetical protein NPIL_41061 [Nephila pilipes]